MSNLNKCFFTGRIGNDLELRYTPKGTMVLNFSIAVNSQRKDASGEWVGHTTWVRLVAFNSEAKFLSIYAQKGTALRVTTEYRENKYQDEQGKDRYSSGFVIREVEITGGWKEQQNTSANLEPPALQPNTEPAIDFDDNVPF